MKLLFVDWNVNKGNPKARLVLILFRLAQILSKSKLKYIFFPYFIFYIFFVEWLLGIELKWKTQIGSNLVLHHGQGLVINQWTKIGNGCTLRHNTTIGNKASTDDCPIIGNNVNIGANVCIIGKVNIGDNVVIGVGSVVIKDVPNNCIIAGNPARIVRYISF